MATTFDEFQAAKDVGLSSPILNEIIYALPKIKDSVTKILSNINLLKAEEDARADLWYDETKFPDLDEIKIVRADACLLHCAKRGIGPFLYRNRIQGRTEK